MKLKHLEIFFTIMTYGSLKRAAEVLHISQPAASKALKLAEYNLGLTLFNRIKGRLIPTDEAKILFEQTKEVYKELEKIESLSKNLANRTEGHLKIGCLPSLGLSLIPQVCAQFYKNNPTVKLTVGSYHSEELIKLLHQQDIDIGIGFKFETKKPILCKPIDDIPLVYVDSMQHQRPISLHDIDLTHWIHPGDDAISHLLYEYRRFASPNIQVHTYHMAAEFVHFGLGCSIIDMFSAIHNLPNESIFPLKENLNLPITLFYREDSADAILSKKFIDILSDIIKTKKRELSQKLYPSNKNSIV